MFMFFLRNDNITNDANSPRPQDSFTLAHACSGGKYILKLKWLFITARYRYYFHAIKSVFMLHFLHAPLISFR